MTLLMIWFAVSIIVMTFLIVRHKIGRPVNLTTALVCLSIGLPTFLILACIVLAGISWKILRNKNLRKWN